MATAFAIYFSGLQIQYYSDDYQWVFESPSEIILHYFLNMNPLTNWYRPMQAAYSASLQSVFGLDTTPGHAIQILTHALFCFLIYNAVRKLSQSEVKAMLSAGMMLISQANAHAVLSNDTMSQMGGTLFGCLSLWLLYTALRAENHSTIRLVLSLTTFAVALLFKESSISFLPMLFFLSLIMNLRKPKSVQLKNISKVFAPYIIITAAYLVVRFNLVDPQPLFGAERYNFNFGLNIVRNIAMLTFSAFVPISSVTYYTALQAGNYFVIFSGMLATSLIILAAAYGLYKMKDRGVLFAFLALTLLSFFPMALLNRVSELYTYNAMPFASILFGIGIGTLWGAIVKVRVKSILAGTLLLLSCSHIFAIQSKAELMEQNGRRASRLLVELMPFIKQLPQKSLLVLLNPNTDTIEYSVYKLAGFNYLAAGLHRLNELSRRTDFETVVTQAFNAEDFAQISNVMMLSLNTDGSIVRMQ